MQDGAAVLVEETCEYIFEQEQEKKTRKRGEDDIQTHTIEGSRENFYLIESCAGEQNRGTRALIAVAGGPL